MQNIFPKRSCGHNHAVLTTLTKVFAPNTELVHSELEKFFFILSDFFPEMLPWKVWKFLSSNQFRGNWILHLVSFYSNKAVIKPMEYWGLFFAEWSSFLPSFSEKKNVFFFVYFSGKELFSAVFPWTSGM